MTAPSREDLLRAHYRLQHGRFLTETLLREDSIQCASDVLAPMWNHSAWFGSDRNTLSVFLTEVDEWHNKHERRPTLYLDENEIGPCEQILTQSGYERFDRESWMIRNTDLEDARSSDFEIASVSSLGEFSKIFRASFNATSSTYDLALAREPRGETRQIHLIARANGESAAVGSVIIDGELACIYNVGSSPKARGRGAGRAIVEALIAAAHSESCPWIFLQVESGGVAERLYTRLGFAPLFTRAGFQKAKWSPQSQRIESALSKSLGFRGRASSTAGNEGREVRTVSAELSEHIQRLCRREGISQESLIVGLWSVLLARYTNQSEVAFRVRLPGESWQDVRRLASGNLPALTAVKQPNLAPNPEDSCDETAVCFGCAKNAAGHSVLLSVPGAPLSTIELTYRAEMFSKDSIRRLSHHFLTLLESIVANPQKKLRELEMLTRDERAQLLTAWSSGGSIAAWKGESILDLIEAQTRLTPHSLALALANSRDLTQNPKLTFKQLLDAAGARAAALLRSGATPGAAIAVLLPRSLEFVVSILAIWRAGGVFVPLDTSYPAERLAFMVSDSRAVTVITNRELAALLPAKTETLLIGLPTDFPAAPSTPLRPTDPAYIIYTSGSTGRPKGVSISHGALARHVLAMIEFYQITPKDRHLHFSPFTFDASFEQLLPPLAAGASVVIRDEHLWDVSEFIENIPVFGLTMVDIPVAYWHQLAQHSVGVSADSVPSDLRLVIVGGDAMSPDRLAQWQQGPFGDLRLVNAYGPTEATITATAYEAADFKASDAGSNSVPIGRPLPGRLTYILNESLQPAPIRVAGQLYIGGPLLASGYLNRPELMRERFIKNPFAEGLLYATGDMARYLEDGTIEFLGRTDDQIKIRGFRVELGEVETALRDHSSVHEAVVIARDDGAGQKRLIAYVTPSGEAPTERELRGWLRSRLPEYMTPSAILVVDHLPMLTSGKVNRKALPDPELAIARNAASPETPLELQLQLLFQRVLRRTGVGRDESFFELGGNSLQALELIVQIEKATGKKLPLETLFQTPTIQRLGAELQRATKAEEWSSLAPLQKGGALPPLFLVHTTPGDVLGYGNLIHQLGAEQPCYGFQALGLKEGAQPHTSIEDMAVYYVELLRKFQPRGPYYLGGWCFGGIVAVEMAQQLQEAGEEIAALLLLETISVSPGRRYPRYHFERFKRLLTMSPHRWIRYLRAKARYRLQVELDNRMRFRQAGEDIDAQQRCWLQQLERVYNANLAALDSYRSRYYQGKVTLFNAIDRDPGILPDPNYGWTGLADEVEIHEVAGDHDTMLAEPNVCSLANAIRKALAPR